MLQRGDVIKLASSASLGAALAAPAGVAAQDLRKLRIIAVPTDGVKSTLYAQKAGLFKKRGLTVDIAAMSSGAAIFPAVVSGSADIGSGSLFPVFAAFNRGIPVRIIAPASFYTSDHADSF